MKRYIMIETAFGVESFLFDRVFPSQNKKSANPTYSQIKHVIPYIRKSDVVRIWVEDK